jgi:hypothetical protein
MSGTSPPVRRLQEALRRLAGQTRGRPLTGRTHTDADDIIGTVLTDDAVGFDPLPLLCALDQAGVRVIVIGQVAGIMHGSQELTGDLDLLWDGDGAQARCLAAAFAGVSARLTDDGGVPVRCEPTAFRLPKVLFRTATASGDCCTPTLPWGALPVTDFIGRCEIASAGEFMIRYISRQDLISMRLAAGRVKDLRRVRELQALRPFPDGNASPGATGITGNTDTSRPQSESQH